MPVIVRRPGPPLNGLVTAITYRAEVDWAAAAARHGYADQPHLADEFRELAGVTPAEYLRSRMDGPNHLRSPFGEREETPGSVAHRR